MAEPPGEFLNRTFRAADPSENRRYTVDEFENEIIITPRGGAEPEINPARQATLDTNEPFVQMDYEWGSFKEPAPRKEAVNLAARRKYRSERYDMGNTIGLPVGETRKPKRPPPIQEEKEEEKEEISPAISEITPPTQNYSRHEPQENTVLRLRQENEDDSLLKLNLLPASIVESTTLLGDDGSPKPPPESATVDKNKSHKNKVKSPGVTDVTPPSQEQSNTFMRLEEEIQDNSFLKLNLVGASLVENTTVAVVEDTVSPLDNAMVPLENGPVDSSLEQGPSESLPDPSSNDKPGRWPVTSGVVNELSHSMESSSIPEEEPNIQELDVSGELPDESVYQTNDSPPYHNLSSSVQDSTVLQPEEPGRQVNGGLYGQSTSRRKTDTEILLEEQANDVSVLGMPMVPASLVDESTASMIDLSSLNSQPGRAIGPRQHDPRRSVSARTERLFFLHNDQDERIIELVKELRNQGFPLGLATEVCVDVHRAPFRFWVIDNNPILQEGSRHQMMQFNPHRGVVEIVPCSYWTELRATIEDHVWMTDLIGLTTTFRCLRGDSGREFAVGPYGNVSVEEALDRIRNFPIAERRPPWAVLIGHIRSWITEYNRDRIPVVLVMSGMRLPSDEESAQDFYKEMKTLQGLSVTIVIRLSSNDMKAFRYYWSLQRNLELCVVADYLEHQRLASQANPWLTYSLPLHRSREMGFMPRLLDTLDQRLLTKDELRLMLVNLFGRRVMLECPDLHTEWSDFYHFLQEVNENEGRHWRLHTDTMEPWVDMRILHDLYGEGQVLRRERRLSADQGHRVEI